jgi:uncharacterized membrane protein
VRPGGLEQAERTEQARSERRRLTIAVIAIVAAMLGVFLLALAWLSLAVLGHAARP